MKPRALAHNCCRTPMSRQKLKEHYITVKTRQISIPRLNPETVDTTMAGNYDFRARPRTCRRYCSWVLLGLPKRPQLELHRSSLFQPSAEDSSLKTSVLFPRRLVWVLQRGSSRYWTLSVHNNGSGHLALVKNQPFRQFISDVLAHAQRRTAEGQSGDLGAWLPTTVSWSITR